MRWNKADRVPVLIKEHLARRPAMEPCDLYKLLYQGVRGPEHLISSPEAFTERLVKEWHELDFADSDPLWESIRPDGSLLRLNLRLTCPPNPGPNHKFGIDQEKRYTLARHVQNTKANLWY
jgi:hypothetical protein